jgi:hypothetical protein
MFINWLEMLILKERKKQQQKKGFFTISLKKQSKYIAVPFSGVP